MLVPKFDLVIFDLDGVLVDSEVLSCSSLAAMLARYGMAIGVDEVMRRFLGRSFQAVGDYFEGQTGGPLPERFAAELHAALMERFRASLRAMPHAGDVLARIGVRYCLASSSDRPRIAQSLEIAGLSAFFGERIYSSAMVARGKPAPDLFQLAASQMGARPERTLVIEDSESGVLAGKAAGMTVWGFVGGSHYIGRDACSMLLGAGADRIIASLTDLLLQPVKEFTR